MGEALWSVRANPLIAAAIAGLAWLVGLVLSWLVAMALLPESAHVRGAPAEDALPGMDRPQFGWLELAGLALFVVPRSMAPGRAPPSPRHLRASGRSPPPPSPP